MWEIYPCPGGDYLIRGIFETKSTGLPRWILSDRAAAFHFWLHTLFSRHPDIMWYPREDHACDNIERELEERSVILRGRTSF